MKTKPKIYSHHAYLSFYSTSSTQYSTKPIGMATKSNRYPMGYFHKSRYYKKGYYKHLCEHYDYDVVHSSVILNNRGQNKIKIVPVSYKSHQKPTLKTIRRKLMKAMGYRKR